MRKEVHTMVEKYIFMSNETGVVMLYPTKNFTFLEAREHALCSDEVTTNDYGMRFPTIFWDED